MAIEHAGEKKSNDLRKQIGEREPIALRTFTPTQISISKSSGVYHWTSDGRKLYDYTSGVLVTNLGNRLQPLIRYELTDVFVQQPTTAGRGHLRARVQGRSDDSFRYGAVTIHPIVIRSVMVRSPDVLEYQVHQTTTGIDVCVVAEHTFDAGSLRTRLGAALGAAGLADPDVAVRREPSLARDPATGKLRRFVPRR